MKIPVKRSLFALSMKVALVVAVCSLVHRAQGQLLQGTVNGNVTDSSQGAVAGARVVVTDQQTNFNRETVTSTTGAYIISGLPPGTYKIAVSVTGFQTYNQTGINVTPETQIRADVVLTIGQTSENVTVEAMAINLQTDRADLRSEVTADTLKNVPVPLGRNYQQYFLTLPGVSPPINQNSFASNSNRALSFTVNGGAAGSNITKVDGTGTYNATCSACSLIVPALEAIESVSMSTNAYDAEQTTGGGAVNITVKSGTNTLHGSLFEYHSDQHLKAYAWAADRTKPSPKYINNQYGGTVAGPIIKDKLFYFMSFEGTGYAQSTPIFAQVPTAVMKGGDLSRSPTQIYDPLTGNANGSGRTAFGGNIIPPSRIDIGVQNLIATGFWSNPNQLGTGAFGLSRNYLSAGPSGLHRYQFDDKLNWNPSSKLTMFLRFGWGNSGWTTPQLFGLLGGPVYQTSNVLSGTGDGNTFSNTISATYVFSPALLADAHFGITRNMTSSKQANQDQNLGWSLLQIPGLNTSGLSKQLQLAEGGMPAITIDGFASLGSAFNPIQPQDYNDTEKNYTANISWIRGNHNFRMGYDSDFQYTKHLQYQILGGSYISGAGGFHFAQGTTQLLGGPAGNDFNAFASFLLGFPQESGKIYQFPLYYTGRSPYYAVYARDQWQVTPKVTLNFGVRGDYYPFPTRDNRGLEYYDATTNTMVLCGVGGSPEDCGITKDRLHIVPRLGIAYRLRDSLVIRAGYGIATDPINILGNAQNFPDLEGQTLQPPNSLSYATTWRQGIPAVTAPDLSTGRVPVPNLAGLRTYSNTDYVRGYIQTANLTIEQRIRNGWVASAGYVGLRAIDPQVNLEQNYSPIGTGTAGQIYNVLFGRTGSTQVLGTEGTNKYDSLQARTQARFAGMTFSGSYTFGKNLGFAPPAGVVTGSAAVSNYGASAIPAYYGAKNYGPTSIDIHSNFQLTAIAELPFGKGKHWLSNGGKAATVLGGFQLSGLFSAFSGRPFGATASAASLNAVASGQFADCILPAEQTGNIFQWYNKADFAVPANGRFGTCGQNVLRGPPLKSADLGLDRKFSFKDRFTLAFRAEMFNISNTPHHNVVSVANSNVTSGSFMQATDIASTGREGIDERTARFSLRLGW
jgi:Carboxypeptidase regulatory-like domain/TonB dependent receptor